MFLLLDAEISDSATVSSPGFHPFNLWLFLISNANLCCTCLLSSAKNRLGLELNSKIEAPGWFSQRGKQGTGSTEAKQVAAVVYEPWNGGLVGTLAALAWLIPLSSCS